MPRRAPYLLRWEPGAGAYTLTRDGEPVSQEPRPGSRAWYDWLDGVASFAFHGRADAYCTVRKERLRRGGAYWYGYRSLRGPRKGAVKRYIGRTDDLSIARLEEVAARIADAVGAPPGGGATQPYPATDDTPRPNPAPPASSPMSPPALAAAPLLASKLHPPRLPTALVARSRLLDRLDAGLGHKLTIVSAPAGFGKTTLMRQWIAERGGPSAIPVAWVSLDADDNDPLRFWRYVITACQAMGADVGQAALAQLSIAPQPPFDPPPLEAALTLFLNDLTRRAHDGLLILEDYHAVADPRIHETLAFLVDHLPPTLHVALLARSEPPLPLARWRAGGHLQELHAADLRFSPEETADFLRQALPVSLEEKALARIDARLEGWPAGLRLLALTARGQTTPRDLERHLAVLDDGGGADQPRRPILDYFVSEVLQAQPEPLQLFLLQTSALGRLTGALCDAVTGRRDSEALLEAMERAGLFLESLDEEGSWYRYHALFAEAMRAAARRRLGDERLRALSLQASHWYERRALPAEAIDAALHAEDEERAADLIERLVEGGHFQFPLLHTLRRWLERMPDQVRPGRPALCLAYAIALLFTQHPGPPTPELMAHIDDALSMADDGWRRAGDEAGRGQVYAFRAMLAWREGRVKDASPDARQSLAWLPDGDEGRAGAIAPGVRGVLEWRAINLMVIANEAFDAGHVAEARRLFQETQRRCLAAGNRPFARIATLFLGSAYAAMGELHQAEAYYRQIVPDAREQDDRNDIVFALLSLVELSYEWNDLGVAEAMLDEVRTVDAPPDFSEVGELTAFWGARLRHARGQTTDAMQQVAGILARLQAHASPRALQLIPTVLIWQGRFHLAAGDLVTAQRSLDALSDLEGGMAPIQRAQGQILAARLLLAQGRAQDAVSLLDGLLASAREGRRVRQALEIQTLLALAHAACKQGHEAREGLRLALAQAHGERFVRLFVDEGEPLAALLRSLLPSLREPALRSYAGAILQAFHETPTMRASSGVADGAPIEPLSEQERRVLRLLAAGRSNPEIAGELIVSVNTVKGHVKSLYRKLDVRNRLEASEAARRLALS